MNSYTANELRSIFQNPFNRDTWKAILLNLFHADKLRSTPERFTDSEDTEDGYYMGAIDTADSYRIGLFYYKLRSGSVAHKKVGLRNLVRKFVNPTWGEFDAAIVVFNDGTEWRLSFVCDIKEEATAPKRFTFAFGESQNNYRTAVERFLQLQSQSATFENIRKAFSVEALSDAFFDEYREMYADFVQYITGKRYVKVGSKWEEKTLGNPNPLYESTFNKDDKQVRDYIKKMFGRIVFLYFLQRKGWLNGNRQYMHDLFALSDKKDNFLDGVLEPLFFNVLNEKPEYRTAEARDLPGSENIPYLNGGLFAQDEIDALECSFPAEYFRKLFDFLDSYNFTIDENDVDDAEIGIDPEMLGRIFENLLEDNKDKGAFYTPKEIVDYMCRESLIAYLQDDKFSETGNKQIRSFVETLSYDGLNVNQREYLRDKLKAVKICDPAIGSGAFPMGLVNLLAKLYIALGVSTNEMANIKRHIMEQNIYGVDIEKGAVDIARLRFWLAMIVEEKKPIPLPNLHFKIMQGNSLLESYNGIDLSDLTKIKSANRSLFDSDDSERESLVAALKRFYKESDHTERDRLFNSIISNVRRQLFNKTITLPQGTDPSANTDFFLWHTWFSDVFANGGFDIVIGNPPYVLLQNANMTSTEKDCLLKTYKVAQYKVDLYHLFIEKGCNLLRNGGILSFINPTNFLTNNYTNKLRTFILKDFHLESVVNIVSDVFDASVNTGIFMISNSPKIKLVRYNSAVIDKDRLIISSLSECMPDAYLATDGVLIQPLGDSMTMSIISKLESSNKKISSVATVSFGMQLRNRKIFTEDVLENPDKSVLSEFHRPCLTGKDIVSYSSHFAERYCFFNREAKCGGCWDEDIHNSKIKVLVRQVGALPVCGIDVNGYAVLNSAFMIVPFNFDAFSLMGLINSAPLKFYWSVKFADKRKTFPKIKGTYLEELPLPARTCKKLIYISHKLYELVNRGNDISEEEAVLDAITSKCFGLNYEQYCHIVNQAYFSKDEYDNVNIDEVCQD